ncbi:pseudouridylate synthase [Parabacteroides sp. OttesenSCG-928-N08]|nr:pseudouridylate synthase [Parabacteroides sp. OttesenSCG-928-N08]
MNEIQQINILELLPQQPPFVMVDKLLAVSEAAITTGLTVSADNLFVENGQFTQAGIVENMAQTGAAKLGYVNKYVEQGTVKLGFIGEIKKLSFAELPVVGDELVTTVEVQNEVLSTLIVQTRVETAGRLVASGSMKICMTDIEG